MSRIGKRLLIAGIFIPILLFIYYSGGLWLQIFISLVSVLGVYEFVIILKKKKNIKIYLPLILVATLIVNWYVYFLSLNNIIFLSIAAFTSVRLFTTISASRSFSTG